MRVRKPTAVYALIFTVLMAGLILFVYNFNIPNPNMILIAALVLATSIGGVVPGAICAVMMLAYSLFFFSTDHSFVEFTEINLRKMAVITVGVAVNFVSVAILKRGRDKAENLLKKTNDELIETNRKAEQANEELKKVNTLLHSMASRDALTGLRNRYSLRQDFEMYLDANLHVMFLDLDNFKALNDTQGHARGDEILATVGRALTDCFRTSNCYRYGGDEFLIIGENETEKAFAADCANLRDTLTAAGISFTGGYVRGTAKNVPELRLMITQADALLLDAKTKGKNQLLGADFDQAFVPSAQVDAHHARFRERE